MEQRRAGKDAVEASLWPLQRQKILRPDCAAAAGAAILREHSWPREEGARTGTLLMLALLGMALSGWMSGKVFDLTDSYDAAFVNGVAWNLVNLAIATALLLRVQRRGRRPALT